MGLSVREWAESLVGHSRYGGVYPGMLARLPGKRVPSARAIGTKSEAGGPSEEPPVLMLMPAPSGPTPTVGGNLEHEAYAISTASACGKSDGRSPRSTLRTAALP